MTEPVSSDIILVNRGGIDYQTSIGESFPSTDQLPLIPGPPVIALNGQPQVEPAEPNEPIVIIREGEGPAPHASQWQRGASGAWNNIAGETGDTYTVAQEDLAFSIRLKQTFSDGSDLYSNEIVVTDLIPLPWLDWTGGIWHIRNVTQERLDLTGGPFTAWDIDGKNQREISSVYVGEELVFVTGPNAGPLFTKATAKWNFGALTDTSKVTNMTSMFHNAKKFNADLSMFDVSNVEDMSSMFHNAKKFNADLSMFDVSNVEDMSSMFRFANQFNKDIGSWNTSNVTNMYSMFSDISAFNQDISNWDVGNVTDMFNMFCNAPAFNSNISNWNVGKVRTMGGMFHFGLVFNSDISNWDVGNVTDMSYMFQNARAFNQDISNWNVSNVEDMSYMLNNAQILSSDISNWDVSNVTCMSYLFRYTQVFNSDISNWNVSNVTNMQSMFYNAQVFNSDISNWNVGNVANMHYMFNNALVFNQDLSEWCVTKISSPGMYFDTGASAWAGGTSTRPVWGTCPRGENGSTFTTTSYDVTVVNNYGNKYALNGNLQQTVTASVGDTITFDQSDSSNSGHPLRIYEDEERATEVTDGVVVDGTTITFVPSAAGTFYYQCQAHAGMGGQIVVS